MKINILINLVLFISLLFIACSKKIDYSSLQNRNGIAYQINQKEPYSGKVVGSLKNGLRVEQNFKNGLYDGKQSVWWDNGQKASEIIYKNGQKDGLVIVWDKMGNELFRREIVDGSLKGRFRTQPLSNLTDEGVQAMIRVFDFNTCDNLKANAIDNEFIEVQHQGISTIYDKTTGLMWQKDIYPDMLDFYSAEKYIEELNNRSYCGFQDWRLPTLEELLTLMEPDVAFKHIDPLFDFSASIIWSSDYLGKKAWHVWFYAQKCELFGKSDLASVMAVRSSE